MGNESRLLSRKQQTLESMKRQNEDQQRKLEMQLAEFNDERDKINNEFNKLGSEKAQFNALIEQKKVELSNAAKMNALQFKQKQQELVQMKSQLGEKQRQILQKEQRLQTIRSEWETK